MNAPKYIGNAISEYHITKQDIIRGVPDVVSEYDKLSVVMVCLNDTTENKIPLTAMLNVLFSAKLSGEEKVRILEKEFAIPMDVDMGKELNTMCNLSDYVEECGIEKGINIGRSEGLTEGLAAGRSEGLRMVIRNLLNLGMSDEVIRSVAECEQTLIEEVRQGA